MRGIFISFKNYYSMRYLIVLSFIEFAVVCSETNNKQEEKTSSLSIGCLSFFLWDNAGQTWSCVVFNL